MNVKELNKRIKIKKIKRTIKKIKTDMEVDTSFRRKKKMKIQVFLNVPNGLKKISKKFCGCF